MSQTPPSSLSSSCGPRGSRRRPRLASPPAVVQSAHPPPPARLRPLLRRPDAQFRAPAPAQSTTWTRSCSARPAAPRLVACRRAVHTPTSSCAVAASAPPPGYPVPCSSPGSSSVESGRRTPPSPPSLAPLLPPLRRRADGPARARARQASAAPRICPGVADAPSRTRAAAVPPRRGWPGAVPPRDAAPRAPRPPSSVPLTLLGSSPGRASLPRSLTALPCRDPAARPREPPRGEAERQQWDAARPAAAGRRTREAARSGTPLGRRAARQLNRPSVCPRHGADHHRCCCRLRFRPTPWSSATRDAPDEFPFAPSLFSPYPQSPTPQNAGRPVSAAGSHGQELF